MMYRALSSLLVSSTLIACSAGGEPPDGEGAAGEGAASPSGGGVAGEGGGFGGAGGAPDTSGCKAVDVLFVIDNSGSMADNQASLVSSFPGFVAGMKEKLDAAPSYHVGVVTTDDYWGNAAGCQTIGDLVTQTSGHASSAAVCAPFSGDNRFMSEAESDLSSKFACAAQVGDTGSDDERVMRALLNALEPGRNAQGACNAGFSRLDALLVVVIITDEDDVADGCDGQTCDSYGSGGDPDAWVAELLSYRGGIKENVVVLSLIGKGADNPCGAIPNSKILGFTNRFDDNGFTGDVCSSSYDAFFSAALPVIDEACKTFEPPS